MISHRQKDLATGIALLGVFLYIRIGQPALASAGLFMALVAMLFQAQVFGQRLLPSGGRLPALGLGLLTLFSLQSLAQTVWFYSGRLLNAQSDTWTIAIALATGILLTLCLPYLEQANIEQPTAEPAEGWTLRRAILACAIGAASIGLLTFVILGTQSAATTLSIRTPWPLLPPGTLACIALLWLGALLMAWVVRSRALSSMVTVFALFATTSITALMYRIGFGFDGFLHIATEKIILSTGTLNPKPLYYIGHYVFTTWLARFSEIPVEHVERWLIPVATALLIPFALYLSSKKGESRAIGVGALLLPLAAFITTTPQSFAYLLGVIALFLSRSTNKHGIHPIAPLLIAAWSVAVHPLAGVPLFILVCGVCVTQHWQHKVLRIGARVFGIFCAIAAAAAVPLLFVMLSQHTATKIAWDTSTLFTAGPWVDLFFQLLPFPRNAFVLWPTWSSLLSHALPCILIIFNILALVQKRQSTDPLDPAYESRSKQALFLIAAFSLFIAGAVLKTAGNFAFLIDYERSNYADRLSLLALLCLLPLSIPFLASLLDRARKVHPLLGTAVITICLMVASGLSYDALPRNDALITGHGWSVGQSDIEAVRTIDRDSSGKPYTVLANQSVSAAAVSQFGFKRYNGDVFFYPIPTGGPLYETFLHMTYDTPSRDIAKDAGALGGSNLVYVVLNAYWWNATNLADMLSPISNAEWNLGDVRVYKFDLSADSKATTTTSGS